MNNNINLNVKLFGRTYQNPFMLASGPLTDSAEKMIRAGKLGITPVSKTMSVKPARPAKPCMAVMEFHKPLKVSSKIMRVATLANCEDWYEGTPKQMIKELKQVNAAGIIPWVSIGYEPDEVKYLAEMLHENKIQAGAFEVSTKYSDNPGPVIEVVKALKSATDLPVVIKFNPTFNSRGIRELAKGVMEAGVDAIATTNSIGPLPTHGGNNLKPQLGSKFGYGWYSGKFLKPIALRCTLEAAQAVEGRIPIIGCGGIFSGKDALDYLMAGASAVQYLTLALANGLDNSAAIIADLKLEMEKHGFNSIEEVRGTDINYLNMFMFGEFSGPPEIDWMIQLARTFVPEIDPLKCKACGICVKSCPEEAFSIVNQELEWNKEKCVRCGLCVTLCSQKGISLFPEAFLFEGEKNIFQGPDGNVFEIIRLEFQKF